MLSKKRKFEMVTSSSRAAFLLFLPHALETRKAKTRTTTSFYSRMARAFRVEPYSSTEADHRTRRNLPQQDTSGADVDVTRRIRLEILAGKEISVTARNVKIITVNGRVTLRGPVNTEDEKRFIGGIAEEIAYPGSVDNQLEVKVVTAS